MAFPGSSTNAHESKLYAELAPVYDKVFARFFYPRIAAVIRALNIAPGAKVLELGVGTGLALDSYPPHCQVTGVDLAPDMLDHAQERINLNGWRHISVHEMDATNLKLPDNSFDYVMAFHVVSVVPDAARMMREAQRVCKPGGKIIVINHFRSQNRLLAALDRSLEPVTRRWGWHTLERADVFNDMSVDLERIYKTSKYSLFTIAVARNRKPELAAVSAGA
jgi:phosphatidylethanolamine/phosphatidyl-N-methylethanolamine N-methyltransferase